jgi:hypothetical protein
MLPESFAISELKWRRLSFADLDNVLVATMPTAPRPRRQLTEIYRELDLIGR